jgi:hypothetical protein
MTLLNFPASSTAEISKTSTDELIGRLHAGTALMVETVAELAQVWAELEHRGVDLSRWKRGICRFLGRVARGLVAPEAVVALGGSPEILELVARAPIEEQRRIVAGGGVPMVSATGETVIVKLERLSLNQARIVFSDDGVRSPREQEIALDQMAYAKKAVEKKRLARAAKFGMVKVGGVYVKRDEVYRALAESNRPGTTGAGLRPGIGDAIQIGVRVSRTELDNIKAAANRSGTPLQDFIADILRGAGVTR